MRSRRWLFALILILAVALSACERQLNPDSGQTDPGQTEQDQTDPGQTEQGQTDPGQTDQGQTDPGQTDQGQTDPGQTDQGQTDPGQTDQGQTDPGQQVTYVVLAGDTLFKIAQRYGVSVEALAAANGISNVDVLEPGQTLVIPVGGETTPPVTPPDGTPPTGERIHVVQRGENLFRIGLRYGFTIAELAAYNNIPNPHLIFVGQQIRIPPGGN